MPEFQRIRIHPDLLDEVVAAWGQPKGKIQMIKIIREAEGLGLKESKDLVDEYWGKEWDTFFVFMSWPEVLSVVKAEVEDLKRDLAAARDETDTVRNNLIITLEEIGDLKQQMAGVPDPHEIRRLEDNVARLQVVLDTIGEITRSA